MKKLIFKKFFKDTFVFFVTSLLIMSFIVWTIQAVNYFDFVTEDGHGLGVYFFYTIFNFPKIIERLIPFIFFISVFYMITQYELRNELNIFWIAGINKINFINNLILFSILIIFLQLLLSNFISPSFQLKARNFLKNSNIDFFTSLIKEGKFINISKNLTIYIEQENFDESYNNIFIEDLRNKSSKMIYAKKGILINEKKNKKFKLINGRVIDKKKSSINIFNFDEIDLSLNDLVTKTITVPKIQEINSGSLLACYIKFFKQNYSIINCDDTSDEIQREIYKRIYKPIFLPIIVIMCGFLLTISRNKKNYKKISLLIFLLTFLIIVVSETSTRYAGSSNEALIFSLAIPAIIFIVTYFLIFRISRNV